MHFLKYGVRMNSKLLVLGFIFSSSLINYSYADNNTRVASASALGGIVGATLGQQMGGQQGAMIGSAIGGATGAAAASQKAYRSESAIGGGLGGLGGYNVGKSMAGTNGGYIGAALGAAGGAALGHDIAKDKEYEKYQQQRKNKYRKRLRRY